MYELRVSVGKVLGTCTAEPAMKRGDHFQVSDGDIRIPEGGYVCLWALQSLIPLITPKERQICEAKEDDWMWRVHHAQCPDPKGRVVFKIERTGRIEKQRGEPAPPSPIAGGAVTPKPGTGTSGEGGLPTLRVVVDQVKGKCTSGMRPGDFLVLRSGRLYIPPDRHFCLYALAAVLPLLPAKQRASRPGDWLAGDDRVICPDPAGNVIMRIETDAAGAPECPGKKSIAGP